MPDYIVEMIQREKCGTRSPCSDIKKCVCADQAKRITERAFEISKTACSFVGVAKQKWCVSTQEICECRDNAREQLKL
jgi:hypothetical protein